MLAQAVGLIGLGFVTYAFQKENRTAILKTQSIGSALFSLHFFLLGGTIGSLLSATVVARNTVFLRKDTHPWARHFMWPYVFSAISLCWLLSAWEGYISILPVTGMIVATYAMWLDDAFKLRKYIIVSAMLWIPYSIAHHAIPSLINQILVCVSSAVATRKHRRKILRA